MNQTKKIITLILTVLVFNVAFSQINLNEHRLDDVYAECCNTQQGDYGTLNCAIEVGKEWKNEMNKYYEALINVLDTNAQKDLKLAQEQWIKYRDLEYKLSNSLHNMQGTMYLRARAIRSMRIVRTRALELKYYYWIRTEEEEPQSYLSNIAQVITQEKKVDSILPTPDTTFFNNPKPLTENILEKYVKSYFTITQPSKVIKTTSADHPEGIWDCHIRTEYDKISIETYTCDMQFEQTFIFEKYSFEEVKRILRLLFVDDEYDHWDGNNYGQLGGCWLEIKTNNDQITVTYGCGC